MQYVCCGRQLTVWCPELQNQGTLWWLCEVCTAWLPLTCVLRFLPWMWSGMQLGYNIEKHNRKISYWSTPALQCRHSCSKSTRYPGPEREYRAAVFVDVVQQVINQGCSDTFLFDFSFALRWEHVICCCRTVLSSQHVDYVPLGWNTWVGFIAAHFLQQKQIGR